MSDKKIQVELDEDIARSFMKDDAVGGEALINRNHIRWAIEAALPPEYPEGTVAWVTTVNQRCLCIRMGGGWAIDDTKFRIFDDAVTKVEPLRVLADDEISVKRTSTPVSAAWIRRTAKNARLAHNYVGADALDRYADALDAEAKS